MSPKQLKLLRNHCEKDFLKAKKIIWTCENGAWGIKLKFTEPIIFEI